MLFKITVLLAFHNQLSLRKRDFIFYWSGKQLFIKWWRRALQGVQYIQMCGVEHIFTF